MSVYRRNYGMYYTTEKFTEPNRINRFQAILSMETKLLFRDLITELEKVYGRCGGNIYMDVKLQEDIRNYLTQFIDEYLTMEFEPYLKEWIDNYITTRFGTNQEIKDDIIDIGSQIVQKIVTNALYDIFGPLDESYITKIEYLRNQMKKQLINTALQSLPTEEQIKQKLMDEIKKNKPMVTRIIKEAINDTIKTRIRPMIERILDDVLEKRGKPFMDNSKSMAVESVRKAIKEMSDNIKRKILKEIGYYKAKEFSYETGDVVKAQVMEAGAALESSGKALVDWSYDAGDWVQDATDAGIKSVQKAAEEAAEKAAEKARKEAKKAAKSASSWARGAARTVSSWFSDPRLKYDIKLIGKSPSGINIYSFKLHEYKGFTFPGVYQGVMSDEVPWATFTDENGYEMVDYSKLDVEFKRIE